MCLAATCIPQAADEARDRATWFDKGLPPSQVHVMKVTFTPRGVATLWFHKKLTNVGEGAWRLDSDMPLIWTDTQGHALLRVCDDAQA
jgi:hypothetical protein